MTFKPALVVVDVQEDFCPPNGSLAVQGGRDIVPTVNELLSLPFPVKIATKDFHPQDHISFASNHPPPNNKPFESMITITNPLNLEETQETRLWPDHCVQGTKGSELLPELDIGKFQHIVEKGQDRRVEMYSAFADPFTNPNISRSNLAQILRDASVTDVYIAGLAADYCVKFTALDARKEGFNTWVVGEATKPVDASALEDVYKEYSKVGVTLIGKEDEAIQKVKAYS
ncbi:Isochorismatase hydrolase [Lindgomyces ingoldianus]|uniref:Isochorismatase hydrolase n=1 Tax=Lindgomyces ingoldianus TaxID=673940 RepID=A0ACB6QQ90_9PLEO|nr:Isochorismatase hydrolase [Lindgomyces ingoldianus]KAF2469022.1 Isochorismatase hydrolase [Lindgomyces ingoldianus]